MKTLIARALIYYYLAVGASKRRFEEAVINLIISLEALLCTDTTKIRRDLRSRLPVLIGEDEKEKILRRSGELYGWRCAIIHAGRKRPLLVDVRTLFSYTRRAIIRCLFFGLYSKKEIVAEIDRKT